MRRPPVFTVSDNATLSNVSLLCMENITFCEIEVGVVFYHETIQISANAYLMKSQVNYLTSERSHLAVGAYSRLDISQPCQQQQQQQQRRRQWCHRHGQPQRGRGRGRDRGSREDRLPAPGTVWTAAWLQLDWLDGRAGWLTPAAARGQFLYTCIQVWFMPACVSVQCLVGVYVCIQWVQIAEQREGRRHSNINIVVHSPTNMLVWMRQSKP